MPLHSCLLLFYVPHAATWFVVILCIFNLPFHAFKIYFFFLLFYFQKDIKVSCLKSSNICTYCFYLNGNFTRNDVISKSIKSKLNVIITSSKKDKRKKNLSSYARLDFNCAKGFFLFFVSYTYIHPIIRIESPCNMSVTQVLMYTNNKLCFYLVYSHVI